ncbi:hypothetical protein BDV33DRAFT_185696 [Aspergillus novoparasiticus]|uniref:Uncharacterized protein n=1 Tax=Aspergillus novoparasiticus TaxID=986946 RepID=A0A5N6E999_9EURO|nr:hypothetical protein BDV33DRAFT_185696 [Aspergillus novoparasiticus]
MRDFLETFVVPALLFAGSITPAHAKISSSVLRSGKLRARNNTWGYIPGVHHGSNGEVWKKPWNDGKLHDEMSESTSAPPSHGNKLDGPSAFTPSSGASRLGCRAFSGNITVNAYQLYPEHADLNRDDCLVYLSALYKTSVAVYDPYKNQVVDNIDLPGMSGDPSLHLSGVVVDAQGLLSVIVDAGAAFDTEGQNIAGDNFLVKVDPVRGEVLWRKNLTEVTNGVYGGFQDAAHDTHGNTFVVGTFPSSIIKVDANGSTAIPWYLQPQPNQTVHGLTGLAVKGNTLLATDASDGQLYRFNMADKMGHKVHVPFQGNQTAGIGSGVDGILLPSQFNGTVLLVSDNTDGTVVLRSSDGLWTSAEVLGTVPNAYGSQNGFTVDNVEIGGSLYSVIEWFLDDKVPGSLAGNRTQFPIVDITKDVLALLK